MNRALFPYRPLDLTPPHRWDPAASLTEAVATIPDLIEVYDRLGYSPATEAAARGLMKELKGLIRTEVPSFDGLRAALEKIESELAAMEGAPADDALAQAGLSRRDNPFLRSILAARDDDRRILELLNANPVDDVLPFVEEVPFEKAGTVVWRMPVEVELVRKAPVDEARFQRGLDDLQSLVESTPVPRREKERQDVLDAIARLRFAFERSRTNWTPLVANLDAKTKEWIEHAPEPEANERRRSFEALLAAALRPRSDDESEDPRTWDDDERQARLYLDQRWMHNRWLTWTLLRRALARAGEQARRRATPGEARLAAIRREVDADCFDAEETLRRLRNLESDGLLVPSVSLALLRLETGSG